jgi:hypothetical protein
MRPTRWTVGPAATARRSTVRGRSLLAWAVACGVLAVGHAGCTAPRPPLVVTNPDPSVKIPAFKKAVREKDRAAVRQLVADLDNDDPAVRLYAIDALRRMTGETFGYHYYQSDEQRGPAVEQWRRWLADEEK